MQDKEIAQLAQICKALGHPARIKIIQFLTTQNECFSGNISEHIELAPSTVSQHLKILKEAQIIQGTIQGNFRKYCINTKRVTLLINELQQLFKETSNEKC